VKSHKGETVQAAVVRGTDTLYLNVPVSADGVVGIYTNPTKYFTFEEKNYNILQAIPAGFVKTIVGIGNYLKQLKLLFSPEVKAYESVGGFITIGSIFPATWDWPAFWRLTAFLSIMLAILNLLPIPALDGGHVMFLAYEIISGRKPSDKFMEYAQIAGMVLLLGLLVFANGNDIVKLFNK
jgi:regulator of sigma E protease